MSVSSDFQKQLSQIGQGSAQNVSIHQAGKELTCEIQERQPLACRVGHLTLQVDALAHTAIDELKRISDDLAARVTYLLEPLGPVEMDPHQCVVQMRSKPPHKDDDGTQYYELLVRRGGSLSLRRYQKPPRGIRAPIAAILTEQVLVRLAGDLDAVC